MPDQMLASNPGTYNGERPMGYESPVPRDTAPMPLNTIRRIEIESLNYGYVVKVGCQTFAIENASTLIAKPAEYINSPAITEQKWNEGKLF